MSKLRNKKKFEIFWRKVFRGKECFGEWNCCLLSYAYGKPKESFRTCPFWQTCEKDWRRYYYFLTLEEQKRLNRLRELSKKGGRLPVE